MSAEIHGPDFISFRTGAATVQAPYFAGETLLDTARRAGVSIDTSCELGDCGTCMVELLKGSVAMNNNNALTPEELADGSVLACQAVPSGKQCVVRTG